MRCSGMGMDMLVKKAFGLGHFLALLSACLLLVLFLRSIVLALRMSGKGLGANVKHGPHSSALPLEVQRSPRSTTAFLLALANLDNLRFALVPSQNADLAFGDSEVPGQQPDGCSVSLALDRSFPHAHCEDVAILFDSLNSGTRLYPYGDPHRPPGELDSNLLKMAGSSGFRSSLRPSSFSQSVRLSSVLLR